MKCFQSVEELRAALIEKPKTSHKKLFACCLLVVIGILFFANSTSRENFPAEVDKISEIEIEEKISPPENLSAEIKKPDKKFEFPEIKFPQQNNSSAPALPQQNFELPQITFPEKISPPEKIFEPEEVAPVKNYVKVKYWLDGQRSAEWTDNFESDVTNAVHGISLSEAAWSKWKSAGGGSIIFPDAKIYI